MCADLKDRDWKIRIEDILESITKIKRYAEQMDFETLEKGYSCHSCL